MPGAITHLWPLQGHEGTKRNNDTRLIPYQIPFCTPLSLSYPIPCKLVFLCPPSPTVHPTYMVNASPITVPPTIPVAPCLLPVSRDHTPQTLPPPHPLQPSPLLSPPPVRAAHLTPWLRSVQLQPWLLRSWISRLDCTECFLELLPPGPLWICLLSLWMGTCGMWMLLPAEPVLDL